MLRMWRVYLNQTLSKSVSHWIVTGSGSKKHHLACCSTQHPNLWCDLAPCLKCAPLIRSIYTESCVHILYASGWTDDINMMEKSKSKLVSFTSHTCFHWAPAGTAVFLHSQVVCSQLDYGLCSQVFSISNLTFNTETKLKYYMFVGFAKQQRKKMRYCIIITMCLEFGLKLRLNENT